MCIDNGAVYNVTVCFNRYFDPFSDVSKLCSALQQQNGFVAADFCLELRVQNNVQKGGRTC